MKKTQLRLVIVGVALLALTALAQTAMAQQNTPSSKATAQINTVVYCHVSNPTSEDLNTAPMTCTEIFSGRPVEPDPARESPSISAGDLRLRLRITDSKAKG